MNLKLSFLVLLNSILFFSCSTQKNSPTILEGKWHVIDWTYISSVGKSLDKKDRKGMNESINDLILDFKLNQTFATNKPTMFKTLQNKKFTVDEFNQIVIDNQYYYFSIKDNKYYFLLNNVMLQIEKIKNHKGSKIKLQKPPVEYKNVTEILNTKQKNFEVVYDVYRLDKPPKLKIAEFDDNCLIDCLYSSFNSYIKYHIDYSKIGKDTSYFIDFVVDKKGNIYNINIKSKYNKPNDGRMVAKVIYESEEHNKKYTKKVNFSESEKDIISSILDFEGKLIAGVKNGQYVNTKLKLELRLIPK